MNYEIWLETRRYFCDETVSCCYDGGDVENVIWNEWEELEEEDPRYAGGSIYVVSILIVGDDPANWRRMNTADYPCSVEELIDEVRKEILAGYDFGIVQNAELEDDLQTWEDNQAELESIIDCDDCESEEED